MPDAALCAARGAVLEALRAALDDALSPYPSRGVITVPNTETLYRGKVWRYPDRGVEVVFSEVKEPLDAALRESGAGWAFELGKVALDHEKSCYLVPCTNVRGEVIGHRIDPRICPAWVACREVINEIRNARRAAVKARRLARHNRMVYMSTLTLPASGDRSRSAVVALWRAFVKSRQGVRFFHRIHGGWLAFPEHHPTNPSAYHMHVLHPNRIHAVVVRHAWTRFLAVRGYTLPEGTRVVRTQEKYWGNAGKAAEYAAKYLRKGFLGRGLREKGRHRYLVSQGLSDGALTFSSTSLGSLRAALVPAGAIYRRAEADCPVWWLWAAWEPPDK